MDAIQVLGSLIGSSAVLFLLITLLVTLPGKVRASASRTTSAGAVWFGGPSGSERGGSPSGPVLVDQGAPRMRVPGVDWVSLAELSEPGRYAGGASARW
ncbi:hypothetical protein ACFV0L_33275 [Streptosporangium canum]|uniref:Uncharacterized protein n=1 Tax=Streptosporangium canum TaxID=324952 RepID=A0A1I3WMR8_9ACTN|nr:hypothetical protein [Streptosporangium canum]SFK08818.1 hypothetical protein SAMN05216275_11730 [Streptosporangium canum]